MYARAKGNNPLGRGRREKSACHVHLTPVPELHAGSTGRAHRGTLAAATDECLGGSEVQPA
jgi:hypothetical protein